MRCPLSDAGQDTGGGPGSVAFEVELAFECVVDGLDELPGRFEQVFARAVAVAVAVKGCAHSSGHSPAQAVGMLVRVLRSVGLPGVGDMVDQAFLLAGRGEVEVGGVPVGGVDPEDGAQSGWSCQGTQGRGCPGR